MGLRTRDSFGVSHIELCGKLVLGGRTDCHILLGKFDFHVRRSGVVFDSEGIVGTTTSRAAHANAEVLLVVWQWWLDPSQLPRTKSAGFEVAVLDDRC